MCLRGLISGGIILRGEGREGGAIEVRERGGREVGGTEPNTGSENSSDVRGEEEGEVEGEVGKEGGKDEGRSGEIG